MRSQPWIALALAMIATACAARRDPVAGAASPTDKQRAKPWGASRSAPETEATVMRVLKLLADGAPKASDLLADPVVLAPALWTALVEADRHQRRTVVETLGTHSVSMVSDGNGKQVTMDMRTMSGGEREKLARSITFRALATAYTDGTVRPASEAERQLLYHFVPFEIENMPITTVELQGTLLIVVLVDGKLSWLDTPSEYGRDAQQ